MGEAVGVVIGATQMGQRFEVGGLGTVRMGRRVMEDIGGLVGCGFSIDPVCFEEGCVEEDGREGSMGGGRSIFSAAFLDSCLAKSEACHHSRNLRAKMLVGRSMRSELSSLGCTLLAMFRGEKMEPPSPGRAGPTFRGAMASSIALWSAAPSLRIRVPINHMKGEWYFVLSKRYAMLKTSREK